MDLFNASTLIEYYGVNVALKDAGYQVKTTPNPGAVRVIWQEQVWLLTGNGPQSVDAQAAKHGSGHPRHPQLAPYAEALQAFVARGVLTS